MAFNALYDNWCHNKSKIIIDYYGFKFFHGKKILDLGAGHGEIAAALARLGADVLCVDARQENLDFIKAKYPHLKTIKVDLEKEFPFTTSFDLVLSLGVLCHLTDYDKHIKDITSLSENIVLETEVLDSKDLHLRIPILEEKTALDLSFSGEGSIVSAVNIQSKLAQNGATYRRMNETKVNSGPFRYDWHENNIGRKYGNRRFWFIRRDPYAIKMLEVARQTKVIEAQLPVVKVGEPITGKIVEPTKIVISTPISPNQLNTSNPKIRLFYNYYEDKNIERKKEIDFCFNKNIENTLFDIIVLHSDKTPTYNFFFEKINKLAAPNDISIICNSDIFFDDSISLIKKMGFKDFYALSRWDWHNEQSISHRDLRNSQDVWIVRGKIENVDGDIPLGVPFCDNRIAYEFNKSGYHVSNPSRTIKTYHYHNSNIRRYDDNERVPGPILFVEPTFL